MEYVADRPIAPPSVASKTGLLGIAAVSSIGAGAIHAAAIGIHSEHRGAVLVFMVMATLQLAWGGLALLRSGGLVTALGLVINTGAVIGWSAAKTSGLPFVKGLDVAEPVQTADALAVGLAVGTVLVAGAALIFARSRVGVSTSALRGPMTLAAVSVTAVSMFGMVAAGTHVHAAGDASHGHGSVAAPGAAPAKVQAVAPVPYDPSKPIDLSGVPGVTPQQQAAAENLVAVTLVRLPQWSDPAVAEAAGFRSIGDGRTGVEHFVNQAFMGDDVILDPDQPESLVYDTTTGGRRLVAAMYMTKRGLPLDQAPNIGGSLMQWHTHENLCFNAEGKVAGLTDAAGICREDLVRPEPTPMVHVWIEPHPCGPFAALEGIGGGRIPDGETKLCDHAHGAS